MDFEDGLLVSVLKTTAIRHKHLQLEIGKFLKSLNEFKRRPPTLFHTHIFQTPIKIVSSRFYWLIETVIKLYVGLAMEWLT
jgi:hypothetical protein